MMDTLIWMKNVEDVVRIIKKRFPNLTAEEIIKLTHEILKTIAMNEKE